MSETYNIGKDNITFGEAGNKLAVMAQLTAAHSQNWQNFAIIAASMLQQAYDSGMKAGQKPTVIKDEINPVKIDEKREEYEEQWIFPCIICGLLPNECCCEQ